jgi:tryptophan-rich sensory protein
MSNASEWYQQLKKPTWAPPAWLFAPVWIVLYVLIIISFGTVFYQISNSELPITLLFPFLFNLVFNFSFTYVQFSLRDHYLAAIDVVLILVTLIWAMIAIYPYTKWIVFVDIPYLLWVIFATALQFSITKLNE